MVPGRLLCGDACLSILTRAKKEDEEQEDDVVFHHVGLPYSRAFRQAQNFSLSMPAFIYIAGFQLASSVSEGLLLVEWPEFVVSRIAMQLPLCIFSCALGCFVYFLRCPPSRIEGCGFASRDEYANFWLWNLASLPIGLSTANAVTWFQKVMWDSIL